MFAQTRFSVGVSVGGYDRGYYPPAPPAYAAVLPPCPGPDYTWVDGYWSQYGGRNSWTNGYWTRQAYARGFQGGARYEQRGNGFVQDRNRGSERDRVQNRSREGNRDRGTGNGHDNRRGTDYGNGSRDR
jgi:hypothetical protein